MKSKFSKIWGVGLTIALLLSLMVAALPASAANLAYSAVNTPSKSGEVLQGLKTAGGTSDVNFLVAAADGTTMFTYSNPVNQTTLATAIVTGANVTAITVASTAAFAAGIITIYVDSESYTANKTGDGFTFAIQASSTDATIGKLASDAHIVGAPVGDGIPLLYKSTNAGVSWTSSSIGTGLEAYKLVDLAISPRYASDLTIVAATSSLVLYSKDGGATFNSVSPDSLTTKIEGGTITSVDIGTYWKTGVPTILIGVTGGAAAYSNVLKFETNQYSWSEIGALTDNVFNASIVEVAFSPAHQSDAEFLAVSTDGVNTYLNNHFALDADTWNLRFQRRQLIAAVANDAVIAFGSDYTGLTTNTVLVGTSDVASVTEGVIRVTIFGDNVTATATNTKNIQPGKIKSIAVSGSMASANVMVGMVGIATVYRTSAITATDPTWLDSTLKNPTGTGPTVLWGTGATAYAGTIGADSAFSRSTDGGATFNQLSLIDVKDISKITIWDSAVVSANFTFVILANSSTGGYAARSLWVTNNGGTTWEQILTGATLDIVAPSANYTSDKTLYVTDGTANIRKSVNGGMSFTTEWLPKDVTAIALVDKDTYFTGAIGELYKKGLYVPATGLSGAVKSIVLSPAFATDKTMFVGNDVGSVYISTDGGVSFGSVGATGSFGSTSTVSIVTHPSYATNKTIFAAGSADNTTGIKRTSGTSSTAVWVTLDTDNSSLLSGGLAISPRGTLYAASNVADKGIRRALNPLITLSTPQTAEQVTALALAFQSMLGGATTTTGLLPASSKLTDLTLISNNVLFAIEKGGSDTPFGESRSVMGYKDRLLTITDTLAPTSATATGAPAPAMPAFTATAIPALETPYSATLSWRAVTGATAYEVWYSNNGSFSTTDIANPITKVAGITTTSLDIGNSSAEKASDPGALKPGKTYYWKVRVTEPEESAFSPTWAFYTALPAMTDPGANPGVNSPYVPAIGGSDVSVTPTFVWPTVKGATNYEFMIGEDPTFAIIDYSVNTGKLNTHATNPKEPLLYSTVYYWRVRGTTELPVAVTKLAQGGDWATLSFTTMAKPEPVVKTEPSVVVQPGKTEIQVIQVPVEKVVPQAIPSYLLWTIIFVGAVLIIALIILIVRTRRVT